MSRKVKDILAHDYHDWIISLVDTPDGDFYQHYSHLMDILDDVEFIAVNWSDENRIVDAYELRNRYDYDENEHRMRLSDVLSDKKPSVLEVLSATFTRYSDNVLVEPGDPSVAYRMFEHILGDLDFTRFDDSWRFDEGVVREILEKWMTKKLKTYTLCKKNVKSSGLWEACGYWAQRHFGV